jgi:integrase
MRVREINWEDRLWVIPAERMKAERDHEVPLSARALAILKACVAPDAEPDDWVFAGQWSRDKKPLGMNAILHALQAVYPGVTTHGFRSSFRDWAGDETGFPREVAEAALAHKVGDEAEQAYRRGTALEKRRKLMEAWGAYVDASSNIVRLRAQKGG